MERLSLLRDNNTVDDTPSTTAASLSEKAQQIVEGLNEKRKQDTVMLSDFKSALLSQMESVYGTVEQHMYNAYQSHGAEFNAKVQELFECLERVAKLERELTQFKQDLNSLCRDMD